MGSIILADGTIYPVRWIGVAPGLTLSAQIVTDESFSSVAGRLDDAENTAVIKHSINGTEFSYGGYTDLTVIQRADNGEYMILLKGANT